MKKQILTLLMSFGAWSLMAQEVTFDKQLEHATGIQRQLGISPETTVFETEDPAGFSDSQFYGIAAVMGEKDGYVRIQRKGTAQLVVLHESFLAKDDILSVMSYAGVVFRVAGDRTRFVNQIWTE